MIEPVNQLDTSGPEQDTPMTKEWHPGILVQEIDTGPDGHYAAVFSSKCGNVVVTASFSERANEWHAAARHGHIVAHAYVDGDASSGGRDKAARRASASVRMLAACKWAEDYAIAPRIAFPRKDAVSTRNTARWYGSAAENRNTARPMPVWCTVDHLGRVVGWSEDEAGAHHARRTLHDGLDYLVVKYVPEEP